MAPQHSTSNEIFGNNRICHVMHTFLVCRSMWITTRKLNYRPRNSHQTSSSSSQWTCSRRTTFHPSLFLHVTSHFFFSSSLHLYFIPKKETSNARGFCLPRLMMESIWKTGKVVFLFPLLFFFILTIAADKRDTKKIQISRSDFFFFFQYFPGDPVSDDSFCGVQQKKRWTKFTFISSFSPLSFGFV